MGRYSFDSELFRKLYEKQSDTYTRLSVKFDVDWRTIQRWSEGSDIHASNLVKVCNLFHVNPLSFFPCEGEQSQVAGDAKCPCRVESIARGDGDEGSEEETGTALQMNMETYREAWRDLREEYDRRVERMEDKLEALQEKLSQERMRCRELEVRLELANRELSRQAEVKMYLPQKPGGGMLNEEL